MTIEYIEFEFEFPTLTLSCSIDAHHSEMDEIKTQLLFPWPIHTESEHTQTSVRNSNDFETPPAGLLALIRPQQAAKAPLLSRPQLYIMYE